MSYPSAPWPLQGDAVHTLQLVDRVRARAVVPSALDMVSGLPGQTLGVVSLASDGPGSVLPYNELIVVPALTRSGIHAGWWISHLTVDHPDALAGGREIWGLPKELAQFTCAALGVAGAARTYHAHDLTLVAHAPRVIRHATARRQASWRTRG
jgi:acetoacetate decarboxylase